MKNIIYSNFMKSVMIKEGCLFNIQVLCWMNEKLVEVTNACKPSVERSRVKQCSECPSSVIPCPKIVWALCDESLLIKCRFIRARFCKLTRSVLSARSYLGVRTSRSFLLPPCVPSPAEQKASKKHPWWVKATVQYSTSRHQIWTPSSIFSILSRFQFHPAESVKSVFETVQNCLLRGKETFTSSSFLICRFESPQSGQSVQFRMPWWYPGNI